jgi:hypothetical protein
MLSVQLFLNLFYTNWHPILGHNILEPVLKRPSKKKSKTTLNSKNLVEHNILEQGNSDPLL